VTLNGGGFGSLLCLLVFVGAVLVALYWVIRLAVRHALNDVGVRRLVLNSYRSPDSPGSPGAPDAPDPVEDEPDGS
jgi:hypothetical protein